MSRKLGRLRTGAEPISRPSIVKARFAGACPQCGERYRSQTLLVRIGSGWGHWECHSYYRTGGG